MAYHSARHGRSIARAIAEPYLREGHLEEHLVYPVTTETTDHPGGYAGAMEDFYAEAADRIAAHLDAGRNVALLAEGDPLFYSSYMHMHTRLTQRFDAVIVPGVTSVSAASAATGTPLVQGDEVLTILPGTLPPDELRRRLADTDAAVIMKLGRSYPAVREALSAVGRLDAAYYVERASTAAAAGAVRRRRRRRDGALLLADDGAGHAASRPSNARRQRGGGRARARRRRLADPAGPPGVEHGDRSDRVRPLFGPGAAPATGRRAIPATTPTNPRGPSSHARWPRQGRAVAVVSSGDPGRLRHGDRRARGGRATGPTSTCA